jgi:protection-of-telomeres protein 1
MAPRPNKQQDSLPSGFISIRDILDRKRGVGNLVNVIGIIKDFRAPFQTRGSGKRCLFGYLAPIFLIMAGMSRLEV